MPAEDEDEVRLPEPKFPPPDDWEAVSALAATKWAETHDVVSYGSDCVVLRQRQKPRQFLHAKFDRLRAEIAAPVGSRRG